MEPGILALYRKELCSDKEEWMNLRKLNLELGLEKVCKHASECG